MVAGVDVRQTSNPFSAGQQQNSPYMPNHYGIPPPGHNNVPVNDHNIGHTGISGHNILFGTFSQPGHTNPFNNLNVPQAPYILQSRSISDSSRYQNNPITPGHIPFLIGRSFETIS